MPALAQTTLSEAERRALDRLVALLEAELGDDLHAVWLYGSRARGERPHEDGSDIDLLVITDRTEIDRDRARALAEEAAEPEGIYPGWFSVLARSPLWLAQRRAVEDFYIGEVDRDRVLLAGGEVESPGNFLARDYLSRFEPGVRARTQLYLRMARRELLFAQQTRDAGIAAEASIVHAYHSVVNAARAALSEENRFVRSHRGLWHLTKELLVDTGRLSAELRRRAAALQEPRKVAVYGPDDPEASFVEASQEEGAAAVRTAEEFLSAVERLVRSSG